MANLFYELLFIIKQDLSAQEVEAITSEITTLIKESRGDVTKTEFCGLRPLAYNVKKNRRGHYVLLNIISEPSLIFEMERRMRLNENILRYLTLKVASLDNNPSALMQQRHYREDVEEDTPREEEAPQYISEADVSSEPPGEGEPSSV